MLKPTVEPFIGNMPGYRISDDFCPWKILDHFFDIYPLAEFRKQCWQLYKSAMQAKDYFHRRPDRYKLTLLYEQMLDITTACYITHRQKKRNKLSIEPTAPFFPTWRTFNQDPWEVLIKIFSEYELDTIRNSWWSVFKGAILDKESYHTRTMRYQIAFLHERLNELITAAYVITKEKHVASQRTD